MDVSPIEAFSSLIHKNQSLIYQRYGEGDDTILHLIARHGRIEMADMILKLTTSMVGAQNALLDTPVHLASGEGNLEMVMLFGAEDESAIYKVNVYNQSVLLVATSIHIATIQGHTGKCRSLESAAFLKILYIENASCRSLCCHETEIVEEIMMASLDFASRRNSSGCTPLHLACGEGHCYASFHQFRAWLGAMRDD